jgi:5'-nucleotidase / UDP-sugar diphosphatase
LLPFSNTLVLLEMTGSEIKLVLEQALERTFAGASTGSYPYAAGLRYDVNANRAVGSRIRNLEYNSRLAGTWAAINPTATYSVVTNDFIASGLDGYTAFTAVENVVDTQTAYAQAFIDYAIDRKTLSDPPLSTYSTKSFVAIGQAEPPMQPILSGSWWAIVIAFLLLLLMIVATSNTLNNL